MMGPMDDPVQFIRDRLAEEEKIARAATPGPWRYNRGKQWLDGEAFERYDLAKGMEFVGHGGPHPFVGCVAATGPADHPQSMADAFFISHHDPTRVLAELDIQRRLAELHEPADTETSEEPVCMTCDDLRGIEPAYPCRTLRLLALPYADHPDYRDTWRP